MHYPLPLGRWMSPAMLLGLVLALALAGCVVGGQRDTASSPKGVARDQLLSDLAACHLLRVAQADDQAVTDATVLASVRRYGVSLEEVVARANQLVDRYRTKGAALGRRAGQACMNLAAMTGIAPALVRLGKSDPAGGPWLRVTSEIGEGFADRVIRALRAADAVGLVINSPGGSVYEARKLGRYLRAQGLRTAVDRVCVSACIDVLAGGAERYATRNARLGVHQGRVPGRHGSYAGGQIYVADSFRYLREMGVDPDVAIAAASVPNNRLLLIPLRDALATRLLTGVVERL